MHFGLPLTRSLLLLLVIRMAGAPFALPDSPRVHARQMLVMRLCKWLPGEPNRPRFGHEAPEADLADAESTAVLAGVAAHGLSIRGVQFAISRLARLSGPIVHVHRSDCARC